MSSLIVKKTDLDHLQVAAPEDLPRPHDRYWKSQRKSKIGVRCRLCFYIFRGWLVFVDPPFDYNIHRVNYTYTLSPVQTSPRQQTCPLLLYLTFRDFHLRLATARRVMIDVEGPCSVGYNEFDFSLVNEEYRPFDGCKIDIYDTFTKYVFDFLSRFLRFWL